MVAKLWKNYKSSHAYDGYFNKDNKLRKHAKIISSILERYGKKKLQEIEKIVKVRLVQEVLTLEFMLQTIEQKKRNGHLI